MTCSHIAGEPYGCRIDSWLRQQNDTMIPQVLVRWSYLPDTLST
jgi:hypothetical protein